MLTLEEAREILGNITMSDEELKNTLEGLSGLVDAALDDYFDFDKDVK